MNLSSPKIPPILLAVLVAITLIAAVVQSSRRGKKRQALRALAAAWRMTYASRDRLRISEKIHDRLPVPGAAALTISDVIYGAQAAELYCVFTIEYTTGVIRENKRARRVASLVEARDPRSEVPAVFKLASEELSLIEQYQSLNPVLLRETDKTNGQSSASPSTGNLQES